MNIIPRPIVSTAGSLICILALAFPVVASAATAKEVNAQVLLEEAKTNALQRKIVLKQTELDRFEEDLKRAREQAQGLQESLEKVTRATAESNDQLARLAAQKKRLTEMLDVVSLRSTAENAKMEGLKLLAAAQKRSLDALAKGNEETELKAIIGKADIALLSPKDLPIIGAGNVHESRPRPESTSEMRKKLGKATSSTLTAQVSAREAMTLASEKLSQADAAGLKATKRATELGIDEIPALPAPARNEEIDLSGALPQAQPAPGKAATPEKKRTKR